MQLELITQLSVGKIKRKRTGDFLNSLLTESTYDRFRFTVAYMRQSGLNQLNDSLEQLKDRGGTIFGVVGINDGITSLEALQHLKKLSDKSTICYTNSNEIYHPKLYMLDNGTTHAAIVIGSPNLTRAGLYMNGELPVTITLDLTDSKEKEAYEQFDNLFNELLDESNDTIQLLDDNLIEFLLSVKLIISEEKGISDDDDLTCRKKKVESGLTEEQKVELRKRFPTVKLDPAPKTSTAGTTGATAGTAGTTGATAGTAGTTGATAGTAGTTGATAGTAGTVGTAGTAGTTGATAGTAGTVGTAGTAGTTGATAGTAGTATPVFIPSSIKEVYIKPDLSRTDAQQVPAGTNPKGVVTLGKAGYMVSGTIIDNTTYFISTVFNRLTWTTSLRTAKAPLLNAIGEFHLEILGTYKGKFNMRISHDLARVSGQDNVPTVLHWADAMQVIKANIITGKNLELYEVLGTDSFLIKIV